MTSYDLLGERVTEWHGFPNKSKPVSEEINNQQIWWKNGDLITSKGGTCIMGIGIMSRCGPTSQKGMGQNPGITILGGDKHSAIITAIWRFTSVLGFQFIATFS
jgi:hypothetical protein